MRRLSSAMASARAVLGKALLLAGGLTGAALALRILPITARLHDMPSGHPIDAVSLIAIGALACAIGVPRQVVAFVAGYGWGPLLGTALALVAQMGGCAADLFWARAVGRNFARRRLAGRLARLDTALASRPFAATLAIRLLPTGNNLALNLLAGVSSLRAAPFLAASAIGYLPQTVIFALMGHGSELGRGTDLAISISLLVVSGLLALLIFRTRTLMEGGNRSFSSKAASLMTRFRSARWSSRRLAGASDPRIPGVVKGPE
jgi:uncharacterized membrane protein YdjX (TVP38/TMEM64 family)